MQVMRGDSQQILALVYSGIRLLSQSEYIDYNRKNRHARRQASGLESSVMGATIEIGIFLKKAIPPIRSLFSLLEERRLHVTIRQISVFDNWQYENMFNIDPKSFDLDASEIFLKKFTRIDFSINHTWRCVLLTSFGDKHVEVSFALDTDSLKGQIIDIDAFEKLLYEQATDIMNRNLNQKTFQDLFLPASIGVECSVEFNDDAITMLKDDNGVVRWVLPNVTGKAMVVKQFAKAEYSNITVFTRLSNVVGIKSFID
jgi:hypothetical protein